MRRRRGTGGKDGNGTPTVNPPVPQAIDPASGFKVPLSNLVRQWDNQLVDYRFVDQRNPQDFVRGVKDNQALPYSRPEPPDEFAAAPILWEDGDFMMSQDDRDVLYTEGALPTQENL